jgi:hypothetical protein
MQRNKWNVLITQGVPKRGVPILSTHFNLYLDHDVTEWLENDDFLQKKNYL